MTLLYYDPRLLDHDTGPHPERAERLRQAARHLERTGLADRCARPVWDPISLEYLALGHDPRYVEAVRRFAAAGGGRIEQDTPISSASWDVARLAAGAVTSAVREVVEGSDKRAFCLVRPPGHHALRAHAMGFCLFNNVALGALIAIERLGLDRVLIVDWDVHHGNASQEAFYDDPRVGYFSIHRWPFYPGTGDAAETGAGDGLGTTLNALVEFGTPLRIYHDRFSASLETISARIQPQLVLVSAGFDSHRDDPIGSLGLDFEDFARLTTQIRQVADQYAQGRLVSVLEGGYNPGVLAGCVEVHLRGLL